MHAPAQLREVLKMMDALVVEDACLTLVPGSIGTGADAALGQEILRDALGRSFAALRLPAAERMVVMRARMAAIVSSG